MQKLFYFVPVLFIAAFLTGCGQPVEYDVPDNNIFTPPEENMEEEKTFSYQGELPEERITNKVAIIKTAKGDVTVVLNADVAPLTVSNFIYLAEEGFYNGLSFHRVEPGFVVQGGDPAGDGTGGPGYTVPAEISPNLKHSKGAVAMARLPDQINPERASSGSQFYFALDALPFLDGQYTVFGEVTEGMDIVEKVQIGDKINEIIIKDKE